MRYSNIIVDVPYNKKLPYTLFAQGLMSCPPLTDSDGAFMHFEFVGKAVLVLFYTFESFRRAYIVAVWQPCKLSPIALPGIGCKLFVLFEARGHKIDHLKRCLFLLTDSNTGGVFMFPHLFWYRLAGLIQFHGAPKSEVMTLYNHFIKIKDMERKRV